MSISTEDINAADLDKIIEYKAILEGLRREKPEDKNVKTLLSQLNQRVANMNMATNKKVNKLLYGALLIIFAAFFILTWILGIVLAYTMALRLKHESPFKMAALSWLYVLGESIKLIS